MQITISCLSNKTCLICLKQDKQYKQQYFNSLYSNYKQEVQVQYPSFGTYQIKYCMR